jgi:hypothetical protein
MFMAVLDGAIGKAGIVPLGVTACISLNELLKGRRHILGTGRPGSFTSSPYARRWSHNGAIEWPC